MTPEQIISELKNPDDLRASLAIHDALLRPDALKLLADHQDTEHPLLRKRIQQMSSILNRGLLEAHFQQVLTGDDFTNWDVVCQLNVILDQHSSLLQINDLLNWIMGNSSFRFHTSQQLAEYLREAEFAPDWHINRCVVEYLASDVLFSRVGSPLVLAVIAERIARAHGWSAKVGFLGDAPVLRDSSFNVLNPADHWAVSHPNLAEFIPVSKRDLAIRLLTLLTQASILEQLHTLTYNAVTLLHQVVQIPAI